MSDAGKKAGNGNFILTLDDVNNLMTSTEANKVNITKKIVKHYKSNDFNQDQKLIAEQILELLVKDTQAGIRKVLSEALKDVEDIPKDIILDLANDIDDVSMPVVEFSGLLTDEDLVEIINKSESIAKKVAIARRDNVTEHVSDALIKSSSEEVVDTLLNNKTAQVSEQGYNNIVTDFASNEHVLGSLIERDQLPVKVIEHLTTAVSDAISERLHQKNQQSFQKIQNILEKSKEVVTMRVIGLHCTDADYFRFMEMMEKRSISTDLMPIHALSMGNLSLFEACMVRKTQISAANVRTLIKDQSNKGIRALYSKAGLPEEMYMITELMIDVIREMDGKIKGIGLFAGEESAIEMIQVMQEKVQLLEMMGKQVDHLDYAFSLIELSAKSAM